MSRHWARPAWPAATMLTSTPRSAAMSTRSPISSMSPIRATTGSRSSTPARWPMSRPSAPAPLPSSDNAHFDQPRDAEPNPSANQIMVADSANGRVQLFDANSLAYVATLGGPGLDPAANNYLGSPVTAAFDPTTNLVLFADAGADDRVQVLAAMTYGYVLTLGTTGSSGPGSSQFAGPAGVAVDPTHARIFIGDPENDRVQVFSIAPPVNFAAVLPGSRSVLLGTPATIFASMINAGSTTLVNCRVALPVTSPAGLTLDYQTNDPTTNALTGTAQHAGADCRQQRCAEFPHHVPGHPFIQRARLGPRFRLRRRRPGRARSRRRYRRSGHVRYTSRRHHCIGGDREFERHRRDPRGRCHRLCRGQRQCRGDGADPRLGRYRCCDTAGGGPHALPVQSPAPAGRTSPHPRLRCR